METSFSSIVTSFSVSFSNASLYHLAHVLQYLLNHILEFWFGDLIVLFLHRFTSVVSMYHAGLNLFIICTKHNAQQQCSSHFDEH